MIMDNLSSHWKSSRVQYARDNRIILVATPTYSSWLNAIEAHFTALKKFPRIISLPDRVEFGSIYSKNGKEFYYAIEINGKAEIRLMKFENNKWSEPVQLMVHNEYSYNDPFLTPDEKRLFLGWSLICVH
jgi:hypothetical protein